MRWNEHPSLYSSRLLPERSEGIRASSTQPRVEHDPTCENELGGDRACLAVDGATSATILEGYIE
jgi:hypothetical protein